MSTYDEQFVSHTCHETLSQLRAAIEQKFKHKADDTATEAIDKLRQVVSFISSRLESASPTVNPVSKLNTLQKGLQASLSEVNQYASNGNSAHLTNACNQIDAATNAAAQLVTTDYNGNSVDANSVLEFKREAEKAIHQVQERRTVALGELEELEQKIASASEELSGLTSTVSSVESSADSKFDEFEIRFEAGETERATSNLEHENKRSQEFTSIKESLETDVKTVFLSILDKKKEAERIVNLVGNVGLTGNYKGAKESEKKAADWLRIVALICFAGGFIVIAATLALSTTGEFDPWQALLRFGAGAFLLVPGSYAARESTRHRDRENKHKRAELELATINAYLEDLPKDKRDELKASLTERFFGNQGDASRESSAGIAPGDLVGLLKDAIRSLGTK